MSHPFDLPRSGIRVRGDGSCVLIMEAGARWPQWIGEAAVISLVLQGPREPATEFASRAIHAIEQVRSARGELRTLVLATGDHLGDDVFTTRCLICRAAVACMPARKPSLFVFNAHDSLALESRHELLSLAGALTLSLRGTRIGIRVKVDESPRAAIPGVTDVDVPEQSGVFETSVSGAIREVAS